MAPPTTIPKLEKLCKVIDSIIKFMVVRHVKKKHIEAFLPKPKIDDKISDAAPVQETAIETGEEAGSPEDK